MYLQKQKKVYAISMIFVFQKAYDEIQRVPPGGQLQITHNPPAKPKRSSVEHRSKKKYVRYLYQQYTEFIQNKKQDNRFQGCNYLLDG